MQYPRLAIVDLETTGADPTRDRITEIAILVTEGGELVEQWSSLVNPGIAIPYRIQELIGITDEMVADAPAFEEFAGLVHDKLRHAIFVAHNVRFDYNFMRASFERVGNAFHMPALCTVKLSRALHPEHQRHGLDAIIARHGYSIASRHRALDDAQIVWQFLRDCQLNHAGDMLRRAWNRALSDTPQPRMPQGDLEALPECPGVFVLRNAQGHALEIGRARNLRSEVLGLFTRKGDARSRKRAAGVSAVDHYPAAGELDAMLQELRVQRSEGPPQKRQRWAWAWRFAPDNAGGEDILQLLDLDDSDPEVWGEVFGCLRGELEARKLLRDLAARHRLCPRRLGIERGQGGCHAHALGKCAGVCADKESVAQHDLRLLTALSSMRLRDWPGRGPMLIAEGRNAELPDEERRVYHVFDRWCHLGSYASHAEALEQSPHVTRRFDADIYRMLVRWFASAGQQGQNVQSLQATGYCADSVPV